MIQLSTSPTFATTLGTWSLSDAALVVQDFANGTYYWHVRTFDSAHHVGEWSDTWSFQIAVPAPPTPPSKTTTGSSTGSAVAGEAPSPEPSDEPTAEPSDEPTDEPSAEPSASPSADPEATGSGDSGFPVWIIIGIVVVVLAGGGLLIRFLVVRRA
jgi:hypothetical protein